MTHQGLIGVQSGFLLHPEHNSGRNAQHVDCISNCRPHTYIHTYILHLSALIWPDWSYQSSKEMLVVQCSSPDQYTICVGTHPLKLEENTLEAQSIAHYDKQTKLCMSVVFSIRVHRHKMDTKHLVFFFPTVQHLGPVNKKKTMKMCLLIRPGSYHQRSMRAMSLWSWINCCKAMTTNSGLISEVSGGLSQKHDSKTAAGGSRFWSQ